MVVNRRLGVMVLVAALVGAGGVWWLRTRSENPRPVPTKAISPTMPPSQVIVGVPGPAKPAVTYVDAMRPLYPALATTRPIEQAMDIRFAAHLEVPYPVYLDGAGCAWITHPDAEESAKGLLTAADHTVQMTPRRVVFVHWARDVKTGEWRPTPVCIDARGEAFEAVSVAHGDEPAIVRTPIPADEAYDWSAAFTWRDGNRVIVPTDRGAAAFDPASQWARELSPPLVEGEARGSVQVLPDARGVLAWVSAEGGTGGKVARFVEGKWQILPAEQWPPSIIHLVPLRDGSVLQILRGKGETVQFNLVQLDAPKIDERKILALVDRLGDADEKERDKAYAELTLYAHALWPILEKAMDGQVEEVRVRLRQLLKSKVAPTLGGLSLVEPKMKLLCRHADGGVLFYAEKGVTRPTGGDEPQVIEPAFVLVQPGYPVRVLDGALAANIDAARTRPLRFGDEWMLVDEQSGPQYVLGNQPMPLLRKSERKFVWPIGTDRNGRWYFRQKAQRRGPASGPTSRRAAAWALDEPTLMIDPTLPDPRPRLPVWLLAAEGQEAGWTRDNYPARKSGGVWALEGDKWRALADDEPFYTKISDVPPTTMPATPPISGFAPVRWAKAIRRHLARDAGARPLLVDAEGNQYFGGEKFLQVIDGWGERRSWSLPAEAQGADSPTLIRAPNGRLFLFNSQGRVVRLRLTLDSAEPFALEAVITHRIPASGTISRIWLDPAGRIAMAYDGGKLAILFAQGFIPQGTWSMLPAVEQDAVVEDSE